MASAKKSNARRRPVSAAQERKPDAASPAIVSGATAALRVAPSPVVPDPEVGERAARRRFTAEYKLQVLREVDQCAGVGEVGALLRREGLSSSHVTTWRRQREHGGFKRHRGLGGEGVPPGCDNRPNAGRHGGGHRPGEVRLS